MKMYRDHGVSRCFARKDAQGPQIYTVVSTVRPVTGSWAAFQILLSGWPVPQDLLAFLSARQEHTKNHLPLSDLSASNHYM